MSTKIVEAILSKAMSDANFADALFTDAEKALAGYDLSSEEIAKFKGLTRAQFQSMTPEERKSYGILVDDRRGKGPNMIDFANHNQSALCTR